MDQFQPALSQEERLQMLQDNADKIEETTYLVPLTQVDLDIKRETFTNNAIWLGEEAEKKAEFISEYKHRIAPKAEENSVLLNEITTKQAKKTGKVYHVPDYSKSVMVTYDAEGYFVSSRRLTPEEKRGQSKIFDMIRKDGTNG